jgi:hypothetical protein
MPPCDPEADAAAAAVLALVKLRNKPAKKRRHTKDGRPQPATKTGMRRTLQRVEEMRLSNNWLMARPTDLVALYWWCHEQTYGVPPNELRDDWMPAASAASKLIKEVGSVDETVEFIRWTWAQEQEREKWRRDNGREFGRVTWRDQFQKRALLTSYRIREIRRK